MGFGFATGKIGKMPLRNITEVVTRITWRRYTMLMNEERVIKDLNYGR